MPKALISNKYKFVVEYKSTQLLRTLVVEGVTGD